MISVVCWKWAGRTMGHSRVEYTADHVNRLASMVSRNLRMPHEIVCVTDDPAGIDGAVRIVPMWDELKDSGRCFRRLKAFARDMRDLGERFVSIDLDMVITGPLDPLFDRPEPFVIWSDPSRTTPYCGSLWMLTAGAHPEVWDRFDMAEWHRRNVETGYFGSDQAWMAHMLPGAPTWTRKHGVWSFRMHILRMRGMEQIGRQRFSKFYRRRFGSIGPHKLDPGARVVAFHGLYDPSHAYLYPHFPWIEEHWR